VEPYIQAPFNLQLLCWVALGSTESDRRADPATQSPESNKTLASDKNNLWSCKFRIFDLEFLGRSTFTVMFGTKIAPNSKEI